MDKQNAIFVIIAQTSPPIRHTWFNSSVHQ